MVNSLSRKDEMFNDLVDERAVRCICFDDSIADVDGKYILQVFYSFSIYFEYE